MTDPRTLADEDLAMSGEFHTDGPYDATDGYPEPDFWDSHPADDWDRFPAEAEQPPSTPWYRNPRLLFGLIAVAAAALVVATVLLITGKQSGEIQTTPQLSTRTTPATPSARSTPRAPSETESSTTESPSPDAEASLPDEFPTPLEPEQPEQPVQSEAPAPSPAASPTRSQSGPRINVTRTPMSFTPGKR